MKVLPEQDTRSMTTGMMDSWEAHKVEETVHSQPANEGSYTLSNVDDLDANVEIEEYYPSLSPSTPAVVSLSPPSSHGTPPKKLEQGEKRTLQRQQAFGMDDPESGDMKVEGRGGKQRSGADRLVLWGSGWRNTWQI